MPMWRLPAQPTLHPLTPRSTTHTALSSSRCTHFTSINIHTLSRIHTCATHTTLSLTRVPLILLRSLTLTALFLSRCTHDTRINIHTLFSSHTHVRHAYCTLSRTRASHTATIYDSHGVILEQVYILNQCTHMHTNSHTYTCAAPTLRALSLSLSRAPHIPPRSTTHTVLSSSRCIHATSIHIRTLSHTHTHVHHPCCAILSHTHATRTATIYDSHSVVLEHVYTLPRSMTHTALYSSMCIHCHDL